NYLAYFYQYYYLTWNINIKYSAFVLLSLCRNHSMVIFYNFFHNGQSYTRSGIFASSMQSLEHLEYFIHIFLFETNPIIRNTNMIIRSIRTKLAIIKGFPLAYGSSNFNMKWHIGT